MRCHEVVSAAYPVSLSREKEGKLLFEFMKRKERKGEEKKMFDLHTVEN